jgi:hypothetical protein
VPAPGRRDIVEHNAMELLRRSLLVGCVLPGLWLLRLAPLDPLLTVVPVDFAAIREAEARRVPDAQKTEAQRRDAEIPLSVYIEEKLQYNIYSAAGPEWERVLGGIDETHAGASANGAVYFRQDQEPMPAVLDKLGAGGGVTYISISRPGEERHYRVDRRAWTRKDFRVGRGFGDTPIPPTRLLYPFRVLGLGSVLAGIALFLLLPSTKRAGGTGPGVAEIAALAAALAFFAAPLVLVGGSVQALTRAPWLTIVSWSLAACGVHLFARPGRNAPDPLAPRQDAGRRSLYLREGLAFLVVAFGPLIFLAAASLVLWDR